jgi:tyrosyl-tRNA synthetase
MHIAQGVMKAVNVNKLTRAGCTFKFWVADWFAQLNNKMGGDLKKIQTVGRYMVEVRSCRKNVFHLHCITIRMLVRHVLCACRCG